MSTMPPIRRAIVLLMILHGLVGCDGSKASYPHGPSVIPQPPQPPAGLVANSISPTSGASWRGTNVEILGSGFLPGAVVSFGAATATNVRIVDSGTIWTKTPFSTAGNVDVIVTNPGGARTAIDHAYTFTPLPLPTLTPSASTVAPGSALSVSWNTVSGGNLDWIGIFELGSGNGEAQSLGWRYTQGATSGTFTLVAPGQIGEYEFRYLPDDEYTVVARSSVVTVRQP
jgi:hypothetical protein